MQLTILALGSQGDVQPYVALGTGLQAAGYKVRVATFESFAPLVEGSGLELHPIAGDAKAFVQVAMQNDLMGTRNPLTMMRAIMQSFGQGLDAVVDSLSSESLQDSDAILNQLPGSIFGLDLAEKLSIPHLTLSVIPLTPTREFPSPLLAARDLGPMLNKQSYYFSGQLMWLFLRGKVSEFRRRLGLRDASGLYVWPESPVINGFSAHVVPRPADWGPGVHQTGYWTLEEPDWQPSDALLQFLADGPPPVYIGFGSMIAPDAEQLNRILLDAVQRSGQRAIFGKGWASLGGDSPPEDVFLLDYAPYAWLFPKMAAVIHHGGSGTTGLALRSGVPSMVVPFGADQPYWGWRTQALKAGVAPIAVKQLTAERLVGAIQQLTTDDSLRHGAAAISQRLAQESGIQQAVGIIEGYLKSA